MLTLPYRSLKPTLMAAVIAVAVSPAISSAALLDSCYKTRDFVYKNGTATQEKAWNLLLASKKKSNTFDADGSMAKDNGNAKKSLNDARAAITTAINAVGDPVVKNQAEYNALDKKKADACNAAVDSKLRPAEQAAYNNYSSIKAAADKLK